MKKINIIALILVSSVFFGCEKGKSRFSPDQFPGPVIDKSVSSVKVGSTITLKGEAKNAELHGIEFAALSWEATGPVKLTPTGLFSADVTGLAPGQATVVARWYGGDDTIFLTVVP